MEKKPLISIILPIYNIEQYLPKCMDSILNQTYKNLEIIMVDDGSTDSCGHMCDEYRKKDSRIVVLHKSNGGLSDARNYGIRNANGKYIACVDPDDYVDNSYVEYLVGLVMKYGTKMSICQHRVIYDSGKIKENGRPGDECLGTEKCLERMLYHDVIDTSAWAKMYHRSLFSSVEYPNGKLFEDIGTTYALMMQCDEIAVGYESKYTYVFHNNSIVNSSFKLSKLDMLDMTDKMAKDVCAAYPGLEKAVKRRQVYARFSTLNQMLDVEGFEYISVRENIIRYILANKNFLIKNSKCSNRDKIAVVLLKLGFPLYRMIWKLYLSIEKGN